MSAEPELRHDLRTLAEDVQHFAFRSAAIVVGRYAQLVDSVLAGGDLPSSLGPDGMMTSILDSLRRQPHLTAVETLVLPTTSPGSSSEGLVWIHNPTPAPATNIDLEVTPLMRAGAAVIPLDALSLSPQRTPAVEPRGRQQVVIRVAVPVGQAAGVYHGLVIGSLAPSDPIAIRLEVAPRARAT